ncbi:MAG: hypothetical protein J1E62_02385 [Lachnospiraceae bacterium]|nr:hypothetical protein [Lachnospiraceae bacterium]
MEPNNNDEKIIKTETPDVAIPVTGKKNNVKVAVIAVIVAVLAIVGVAGAANADRVGNFIRRSTSSPEKYYQYVEKENRNEVIKGFDKTYNSLPMSKTNNFQQKMVTRIEVGDALKPLLSSLGLETVEVEGNSKIQDKEVAGKAVMKVNDVDALTLNVYLNYETGKMYMQMPELSDKYIDFSDIQNQAGINYAGTVPGNVSLPDEKTMQNIMKTYTDVVINDISDVEKSSEKLEVEGVSAKCTKLEVKVDSKTCYKIVKDAGKKLENDEDVKSIIENIDSSAYEDFQDAIKSFNEDLDSTEEKDIGDDLNMQMDVYVDAEGNIAGRIFTIESEGESITLKSLSPTDGDKFGYEFSVLVGGINYVRISGEGKRKSGKLDATYHLSVDESLIADMKAVITDSKDMITFEVKDFDEKAWEDGILKGEFTISSDKIAPVALYSLKWKFDGDKNKQNAEISVLSGKVPMVTLTMVTSDDAEDPQVSAPGDDAITFDATDEGALEEYFSEADLKTFLNNLRDKCGVDLTSLLGMYMPSDSSSSVETYDTMDMNDLMAAYE